MSETFPQRFFRRYDEAPDQTFYGQPRFVTHIDDGAIEAVGEGCTKSWDWTGLRASRAGCST